MKKVYLKDLPIDEVIRRLKAGKVVRYDNTATISKLIEGFLCDVFTDGDYRICSYISARSQLQPHFEEQEQLKLEVGKCYRTRDGRKAFIFVKDDYNYRGVVVGSAHDYAWRENCKSVYSTDDNDLDIISEWSDDDVAED